MNFRLYREYGALNSKPVFDALESGLKKLNHKIVDSNEDVSVIWSVLWNGRMLGNKHIYEKNLKLGKKTLIIEVGNLKRGITWRVSFDHINKKGFFNNHINLDDLRPSKLGVYLKEYQSTRSPHILITGQHDRSLQWAGQPSMGQWVNNTIATIRKYSDREIFVRPHPRCPIREEIRGAKLCIPKKINGSYDDFDIDFNFHCLINFNSGPAVQAAINGVPIICDITSLAYDVSDKIENIEKIHLPDRKKWFLQLAHTEWTVDEIASGEPLKRILQESS